MKAAIVAIAGPVLTAAEADLLRAHPPAGLILFKRNVAGKAGLARLAASLRGVLAEGSVLMVDQEGGRVARLGPPDWPAHPAAGRIGAAYAQDRTGGTRLAWVTGALIGLDCAEAGFDVVCAPVLDLGAEGMTEAIGDRVFGAEAGQAATLGQAMADGLMAAGVQAVGKHAPGHGQARVDSHVALPRLGAEADIGADVSVFRACAAKLPWMMTAHIVYEGIDATRAASVSPAVIEGVIRGAIGFEGVLASDDLAMGAMSGGAGPGAAAAEAVAAGCDLAMHCSGALEDIRAVLEGAPEASERGLARLERARAMAAGARRGLDRAALAEEQAGLLAPWRIGEAPHGPAR